MASKISEAFGSAAAIAKGMSVTLGEMMNPTITEDYPDSPPKFQERFRGVHVLQRDENGLEKCVACFLCAAACPADCIYIEAAENTDTLRISGGERYAKVYNIDYSRCIFCGYCVEACPTDAITHGHGFEIASYNVSTLIYRKENMLAPIPQGAHFPLKAEHRRSAQRRTSQSVLQNFDQPRPVRRAHPRILRDVGARFQLPSIAAEVLVEVAAVLEAVHDVVEHRRVREPQRVPRFVQAGQIHDGVAQQPVAIRGQRRWPHINLRAQMPFKRHRPRLAVHAFFSGSPVQPNARVLAILHARELEFPARSLLPGFKCPGGQLRIVRLAHGRGIRAGLHPIGVLHGRGRERHSGKTDRKEARPDHRLSASRSSASNLICASSCSMRLVEVVDQLAFGIGQRSMLQIIARVHAQTAPRAPARRPRWNCPARSESLRSPRRFWYDCRW